MLYIFKSWKFCLHVATCSSCDPLPVQQASIYKFRFPNSELWTNVRCCHHPVTTNSNMKKKDYYIFRFWRLLSALCLKMVTFFSFVQTGWNAAGWRRCSVSGQGYDYLLQSSVVCFWATTLLAQHFSAVDKRHTHKHLSVNCLFMCTDLFIFI